MNTARVPRMLALALVCCLSVVGPALALEPAPAHDTTIESTLAWLRTQQGEDGGFGSVGASIDVALAIVAAGQSPAGWRATPDGPSLMDYLAAGVDAYAATAAQTGKLLVAVAAAGMDPHGFGGHDLLTHLETFHSAAGGYGVSATDQAWATLALRAAGQPVPAVEADALRAYQQEDGAWEAGPGWGADTNSTAVAVQALVAVGEPATSPALQRALAFFREQQNGDGGFPYVKPSPWGSDSDANSTAYVIQALRALGEDPTGAAWSKGEVDAVAALLRFQGASGAWEWQPGMGENILAAAQAVPALMGKTLPLAAHDLALAQALLQPGGPAPALRQGNLVTCVDAQAGSSWLKLYRLTAQGQWEDLNPRGWTALDGAGYLKIDGLLVDHASFGGAGNPYRVEAWADGALLRSAGLFHQGQPVFRIRGEADALTPWGCPLR
ncbi:MAG: cell wall anchor protein [Chloroflexi bacterium]|nr:cell wall anchor protein [Chloroflexota bacterium]